MLLAEGVSFSVCEMGLLGACEIGCFWEDVKLFKGGSWDKHAKICVYIYISDSQVMSIHSSNNHYIIHFFFC